MAALALPPVIALAFVLTACGDKDGDEDDEGEVPGGWDLGTDTGTTGDGGTEDGGTEDGGTEDGGTEDGGTEDGGSADGGGTGDGGAPDGGAGDGGTTDGGAGDGGEFSGWGSEVGAGEGHVLIDGSTEGDTLGYSTALVDLDGDGLSDLVIGAPEASQEGLESNGGVAVFYGGELPEEATLDASDADLLLYGGTESDKAGRWVDSAGDLDGDGVDDLIVTGDASTSSAAGGRTWVVLASSLDSRRSFDLGDADYIFDGDEANDYASMSTPAGDVDGDELADLMIGAWGEDAGGSGSGAVFLYLGANLESSGGLATTADAVLVGPDNLYGCGAYQRGVGDTDGDGLDDVLIGCHRYNTQQGRVWLVRGDDLAGFYSDSIDDLYTGCWQGEDTDSYLGIALTGLGDLEGDGLDDFAMGAYVYNGGEVYGMLAADAAGTGCRGVSEAAAVQLTADASGDRFGFKLASGDIDGDDSTDLLVGGWGADEDAGAVWFFRDLESSGSYTASDADSHFAGDVAGDSLGYGLAQPGDVDGDGWEDLLFGSRNSDEAGEDAGRAYLFRAR